jgi:hypothetical protein
VALTGGLVTHHLFWTLAIVAELVAAWIVWRLVTKKKNAAGKQESALHG